MAALRDQVVELVLRARNLLSRDTDAAAASVEGLAGSSEDLQQKLRALEDQGTLIKNFDRASKAVDRTGSAYDRAEARLEKLRNKLGDTGPLTRDQQADFTAAQNAVDRAARAYQDAEGTLGQLAQEASDAGIDLSDLSRAQRENAAEATKAKRAIADYNEEVDEGGGRLRNLGKSLGDSTRSFVAWGAAAAAAAAALGVGILTKLTTTQANLARETLAQANAFGISTDALQEWQAAARSVGIEGDKTADLLKDVAERLGDAFRNGGGEAVEIIESLNLRIEDLVALSPDKQILAIAKEIEGLPRPEQIQIMEALASDASLLLPLLEDNARGLRELGAAARERGAILSREELEDLASANRALSALQTSVTGVGKQIASRLAPILQTVSERFDEAFRESPEIVDRVAEVIGNLITKLADLASEGVRSTDGLASRFSGIGNTIDGTRLLFVALLRGVQSFGAGAAEVAARVAVDWNRVGLAILELRNKIGLASDEAVAQARFAVENAATSVADLERQSESYKQQMIEAGKAAATAFTRARDGAESTKTETQKATAATEELAAAQSKIGGSAEVAAKQVQTLAQRQAALRKEVTSLVPQIRAAQDEFARDASTENQDRLNKLVQSYDRASEKISELGRLAGDANTEIKDSADVLSRGAGKVEEVGDKASEAQGKLKDLGTEAKTAGQEVEKAAQTGGGAFAIATDVIQGFINKMAEIGPAVQQRFVELASGQKVASQETLTLEGRIDSLNAKITDVRQNALRTQDTTGLGRMFKTLGIAAANAEKQYVSQLIAVRNLNEGYQDGTIGLRDYIIRAEQAAKQSDLLNDADLSQLTAGIAAARQQMESLRQSTEGTVSSLQNELDRLRGDTAAIEERQFNQRIAELTEQLRIAEQVGDETALNNARLSLDLAKQIRAEKLGQAQEAARERAAQQRERQAEREQAQALGSSSRAVSQGNGSAPSGTVTLDLRSNGQPIGTLSGVDGSQAQALLDALERAGLSTTG